MKRKQFVLLGTALLFLFAGKQLYAQAGSPDPSFGSNGMVITDVGFNNEIYRLAVQPDGKILAAGDAVFGVEDFSVIRYNADGSLDTAFGTGGYVTMDFGGSIDVARQVLLQTDGKIILAGYAGSGTGNTNFALTRLNTNGTTDLTFGTQGKIVTDIAGGDDYLFAAGLQSDGKILVAGNTSSIQGDNIAIVRYNTNGTTDPSFGTMGIRVADLSGGYDCVFSLVIQPDAKIVVGGYGSANSNYDFLLARFNADGTNDNSFGTNGVVQTALGPSEDIGEAIAIQPDGKIVIAGYTWDANFSDTQYGIVRYNTNGSIDNTFATNGMAIGSINGNYPDYLRAVTIQSDGKILVAGQTASPGFTDIAIMRFTSSGIPDVTFNGNGIVVRDVAANQDYADAILIQPDGKILIAGAGYTGFEMDAVVMRYLSGEETQSVSENSSLASCTVFPNPLNEFSVIEYTLQNEEMVSISLYDAQGRLVQMILPAARQSAGQHQERLVISNQLAAGEYWLVLATGSGESSIPVVKQR